jgi:hypothetical protein
VSSPDHQFFFLFILSRLHRNSLAVKSVAERQTADHPGVVFSQQPWAMPSCQQREKFMVMEPVMAIQHVSPAFGVRCVWRIGKASNAAISSVLRHFCERITVDDDNGISHCMHSANTRNDFLAAIVAVNLWV